MSTIWNRWHNFTALKMQIDTVPKKIPCIFKNKTSVCLWMGITKSCDHPQPPTTINKNIQPVTILLLPPTTTQNQPLFCCKHPKPPTSCHYFTTATHLEPSWKMNSFKQSYFSMTLQRLIEYAFWFANKSTALRKQLVRGGLSCS